MIKGHSIIELADVNTGEVERYEDDNLVTKGIDYYWRAYGLPSNIWKEVFSGIKIFEENIEEDPNIVTAPLAANMIGYACNYSNTADNMRGILNLEQSGILEDYSGIKLTWDFAQNQANGTVRCICITPETFAKYPTRGLGVYSKLNCVDVYSRSLIGYDFSRRAVISYRGELKTNGRLRLAFHRVPYIYRGITDDGEGKEFKELYVDVPGNHSEDVVAGAFIGTFEEFYYFLSIKSYTENNPATTNFLVIKVKKDTYEVETQEFSFSDPAYPEIYFSTTADSFVFNGSIYIYKNKKYYKFKMQDYRLEKVLELTLSSNNCIAVGRDNVIGYDFSLDSNDVIRKSTSEKPYSNYEYPRGILIELIKNVVYAGKYNSSSYKNDLFLLRMPIIMTINNLTTPVTKTADKTMKITYVLKEDYSDSPTQPTS